MMDFNIAIGTDSYKASHYLQYPPNTTKVYSHFVARGFPDSMWSDEVVVFGPQYYLLKYLTGRVITHQMIKEAETMWRLHFGRDLFNAAGWRYIVNMHDGRLPVRIKALDEGTVIPTGHPIMTVENTDPECYWLTNWLETLLVQAWYPSTVATQSRMMKKIIQHYMDFTGADMAGLPFKLHDFGYRGVTCPEQAGLGGAAHLVNFMGTDNIQGALMASRMYNADMPGVSIPASEHSTITSWGRENEPDAMENMLDRYPAGPVACVSDSFSITNACKNIWGDQLKEKILARDADSPLVVRPDSGEPASMVVHVLNTLEEAFGTTMNAKGFKVLPPQVRVIQGDGIDPSTLSRILDNMVGHRWSVDNIAFGSGGGLLQKLNRDTLKFAFKCSYVEVGGEARDVYKDPITDPGKKSLRGRLKVVRHDDGRYETLPEGDGSGNLLHTVFENGEMVRTHTFDEVRARASEGLNLETA
jgi:nicotinamide phosphoribosyltransferase